MIHMRHHGVGFPTRDLCTVRVAGSHLFQLTLLTSEGMSYGPGFIKLHSDTDSRNLHRRPKRQPQRPANQWHDPGMIC